MKPIYKEAADAIEREWSEREARARNLAGNGTGIVRSSLNHRDAPVGTDTRNADDLADTFRAAEMLRNFRHAEQRKESRRFWRAVAVSVGFVALLAASAWVILYR